MRYDSRKFLVMGFARSGIAAAKLLLSRGARVKITEKKSREELGETLVAFENDGTVMKALQNGTLEFEFGGHREESFAGADAVIVSPGISPKNNFIDIARKAGADIMSELELAWRETRGPVIGITGTNGKTTTTVLTGEFLKASGKFRRVFTCGNIGLAMSECVLDAREDDSYSVEVSSFQLELSSTFRPVTAVLLNITPDHMDRHGDLKTYRDIKARIFSGADFNNYAILNADCPLTMELAPSLKQQVLYFSTRGCPGRGAWLEKGKLMTNFGGPARSILDSSRLKIPGLHNVSNALAASLAALTVGVEEETIAGVLEEFPGVEHRLERVRELDGVTYINDSKATNEDSTLVALKAFTSPVILIAGGSDKGSDFSLLAQALGDSTVRHVVLFGATSGKIEKALGGRLPVSRAGSMEEAVQLARKNARKGDVVLLSPACASFDYFKNYEHRGRCYKEIVSRLI